MSNVEITQLVAVLAGLLGLATFASLVLVPVVSSYQRAWERIVAGFLSLWVLAVLAAVGVAVGAAVVRYWPRVF